MILVQEIALSCRLQLPFLGQSSCGSSDRKDMCNRMEARAQAEARDFSLKEVYF